MPTRVGVDIPDDDALEAKPVAVGDVVKSPVELRDEVVLATEIGVVKLEVRLLVIAKDVEEEEKIMVNDVAEDPTDVVEDPIDDIVSCGWFL